MTLKPAHASGVSGRKGRGHITLGTAPSQRVSHISGEGMWSHDPQSQCTCWMFLGEGMQSHDPRASSFLICDSSFLMCAEGRMVM